MKRRYCLFLLAFSVICSPWALACTTLTLQKDGHIIYGRNLDWHADSGLIIVNQRNMAKKALILPMSQRAVNPAEWSSCYGSVTFNGLGREFPNGGMNEAGLVVDIMWLNSTRYPQADSRPEISVIQWIQYLLDTCQDVDEVLASDSKIRISEDGIPPQHFLISDRQGKTAVIEFIEGKRRVYSGDSLPYPTLTNDTYEEASRFASQFASFGGDKAIPQGEGSLERFVRSAARIKAFTGSKQDLVDYSFDILHRVNAGYELNQHSTVWSIVYDITGKKIHFRTNSNRKIRSIDLAQLDFSNQQPVRVWKVLNDLTGDITRQSVPYTKELNLESIHAQILNPGVMRDVGDMKAMITPVAAYPDQFTTACKP